MVGRGPCSLCSLVCVDGTCCMGYSFCPAGPRTLQPGAWIKNFCYIDEGTELGLSTPLIALLKAFIVLAHCVIFFHTSGPNSSSPVSPKSSLQISFKWN